MLKQLGVFNSQPQIWLGLKYAKIAQNLDIKLDFNKPEIPWGLDHKNGLDFNYAKKAQCLKRQNGYGFKITDSLES